MEANEFHSRRLCGWGIEVQTVTHGEQPMGGAIPMPRDSQQSTRRRLQGPRGFCAEAQVEDLGLEAQRCEAVFDPPNIG